MSRRRLLKLMGLGVAGTTLAACQPEVVKETVVVEKEKVVKEEVEVEKEVTRVVEKEEGVATPFPPSTLRFGFRVGQKPQAELMVTSFQTEHPDVEVEMESSPNEEAFQKFQVQAAANTLPEVLWIGNIVTWTFAEDGVVIDMKPMAELDPDVPLDDIYDPLVKMCSYRDGWYMVPWAADAPVMYYNKTLFENAGLPEPPVGGLTVDEFIQASEAITDEEQQIYGTSINVKWNAIHLAWFSGYGGQFWNEDKTGVLINSPECVEAAQVLADLYNRYECIVPYGVDLGGDPFVLGQSGTMQTNRWGCYTVRSVEPEWEWDVILPPIQPDHHAAITGTMGPAVGNGASREGKEQLAYELATSMLNPPVQRHFARQYMMIPVLKSLAKDSSWYDLPAPPENRDVFLDVLDIAETLPLPENTYCGTPTWGFMFDTIDEAWDEMIIGGVPAQEALDKAAEAINECLAEKAT